MTLDEAVEYYANNDPRGEFVLVVEGASASAVGETFWKNMSIAEHVTFYIEQGMTKNDAIKAAAKDRKVPKNEIYKETLDLKA